MKYWQIHAFTYVYFLCLFTEKGEFNRKVCVHCNATFHSGVSLSNHLRAYAKRKRNALLEGTSKCHLLHTNQDANPKSRVAVEEDVKQQAYIHTHVQYGNTDTLKMPLYHHPSFQIENQPRTGYFATARCGKSHIVASLYKSLYVSAFPETLAPSLSQQQRQTT